MFSNVIPTKALISVQYGDNENDNRVISTWIGQNSMIFLNSKCDHCLSWSLNSELFNIYLNLLFLEYFTCHLNKVTKHDVIWCGEKAVFIRLFRSGFTISIQKRSIFESLYVNMIKYNDHWKGNFVAKLSRSVIYTNLPSLSSNRLLPVPFQAKQASMW